MVIAGDVGGTKTILALYEFENGIWVCHKRELYASANHSTFTQLLSDFLFGETVEISAACIGVAGPIVNGDCETTNLPWVLRRQEISKILNTGHVWLLNDLEATAWGVLHLPDDQFVYLHRAKINIATGNIALVAAGTGLGEAIITYDNASSSYRIIATEGGHTDFAPTDQQQIGLLTFLIQKYSSHVSYERLLSGEGLVNIYDYLKVSSFAAVNPELEEQMLTADPAAIIGYAGVERSDKLCVEALNLFCRIYGAEAGNMALKCLPSGGVYLAGGIATKIMPALQNGEFVNRFLSKGRMQGILQNISVKVCINTDAGLMGALNFINKSVNT